MPPLIGYDPEAEGLLEKLARGDVADDITKVNEEIERIADETGLEPFKICRVALRMMKHEIGDELQRAIPLSYGIYLRLLKGMYELAA